MKELDYPFDSTGIRRQAKKLKKELLKQDNRIVKKVAILSGSTIGQMSVMLELFLLNQGIEPVFFEGQYNNYYEEAVFASEQLVEFQPDVIYVHTSVKNILEWPEAVDTIEQIEKKADRLIGKFCNIWDNLQSKIGCPVIQNNFEMLPYRIMGNMDRMHVTGRQHYIQIINSRLVEEIQKRNNIFLNDLHYMSAYYGLERWFDDSAWYAFKYAFSPDAIPEVAYNISNIIKSYFGKNKKAIVVDLDNTLWKGVIGDDGVDGIEIGIETPAGMLYEEFQDYLRNLKERGILLNICSKNEENGATLGFSHKSSVLKPDDFTIISCNWERKSKNIFDMSEKLNLNTDSFVFIDDNPAEQEEVGNNIHNISVLPVQDVSKMRTMLDRTGYFEITNYSEEDLLRNRFYKANLERTKIDIEGSYKEYLLSLEMKAELTGVTTDNIDRTTQLINKTNQFNLTGLRLSKKEVEEFANRNISVCGTLYDKYGNNGLVSVILGQVTKVQQVEIALWVMSCRVFKRDFEYAMFDELVEICQKKGIKTIIGKYISTNKNMPVEHLYEQLDFGLKEEQDGIQIWEYAIPENYKRKNTVITV